MAAKRAEWRPGGGGVREIGWQVHGHPRAGGLGGSGWGFLGAAVHGRRQKSAWLSPTGGVRESKTEISVEDTRYAGASAYWVTYGGWGIALRVLVMGEASTMIQAIAIFRGTAVFAARPYPPRAEPWK